MESKLSEPLKKGGMDKYKLKVKDRDEKINEALGILMENDMIENPYKIEKRNKSPFRKTTYY